MAGRGVAARAWGAYRGWPVRWQVVSAIGAFLTVTAVIGALAPPPDDQEVVFQPAGAEADSPTTTEAPVTTEAPATTEAVPTTAAPPPPTEPPPTQPPPTRPPPTAPPATAARAPSCHPEYSGACLPPNASDVDCGGGSGNGPEYAYEEDFQSTGSDPYGLDSDGDGVACES